MLKVGDEIVVTATWSSIFGLVATIIEVDVSDSLVPYKVQTRDGRLWWVEGILATELNKALS